MAIRRRYHTDKGVFWVTRLNLDDLFGSGIDLCKVLKMKREREARQLAKDIFSDMCQRMATDMVQDQSVFVFPHYKFGFVRIADLSRFMNTAKYHYDLRYEGKVFGPVVVLNNMIRRVNGGRNYGLKLIGPFMQKIRDLRATGIRWP